MALTFKGIVNSYAKKSEVKNAIKNVKSVQASG